VADPWADPPRPKPKPPAPVPVPTPAPTGPRDLAALRSLTINVDAGPFSPAHRATLGDWLDAGGDLSTLRDWAGKLSPAEMAILRAGRPAATLPAVERYVDLYRQSRGGVCPPGGT
jgi:hypothetical protein